MTDKPITPGNRHFEALARSLDHCDAGLFLELSEIPDLLRTIPDLQARVAELEVALTDLAEWAIGADRTIDNEFGAGDHVEPEEIVAATRVLSHTAATPPQAPATPDSFEPVPAAWKFRYYDNPYWQLLFVDPTKLHGSQVVDLTPLYPLETIERAAVLKDREGRG